MQRERLGLERVAEVLVGGRARRSCRTDSGRPGRSSSRRWSGVAPERLLERRRQRARRPRRAGARRARPRSITSRSPTASWISSEAIGCVHLVDATRVRPPPRASSSAARRWPPRVTPSRHVEADRVARLVGRVVVDRVDRVRLVGLAGGDRPVEGREPAERQVVVRRRRERARDEARRDTSKLGGPRGSACRGVITSSVAGAARSRRGGRSRRTLVDRVARRSRG